jgi:hypothetical protein
MNNISPQSLGGRRRAKQQRETALANYHASPNYCVYCENLIDVPDGIKVNQIRVKKFCNLQCYKKYKVGKSVGRQPTPTIKRNCQQCGNEFTAHRDKQYRSRKRFCGVCPRTRSTPNPIENLTKHALFEKRKNWQSARGSLRRNAYTAFRRTGQPMACLICGYNNHVQIAHRKAVSSFANDALVSEINSPKNLVALCPNHHWEYDHKLFSLL